MYGSPHASGACADCPQTLWRQFPRRLWLTTWSGSCPRPQTLSAVRLLLPQLRLHRALCHRCCCCTANDRALCMTALRSACGHPPKHGCCAASTAICSLVCEATRQEQCRADDGLCRVAGRMLHPPAAGRPCCAGDAPRKPRMRGHSGCTPLLCCRDAPAHPLALSTALSRRFWQQWPDSHGGTPGPVLPLMCHTCLSVPG
jgi:hypothetical protein